MFLIFVPAKNNVSKRRLFLLTLLTPLSDIYCFKKNYIKHHVTCMKVWFCFILWFKIKVKSLNISILVTWSTNNTCYSPTPHMQPDQTVNAMETSDH